jgi:hypothetical protein
MKFSIFSQMHVPTDETEHARFHSKLEVPPAVDAAGFNDDWAPEQRRSILHVVALGAGVLALSLGVSAQAVALSPPTTHSASFVYTNSAQSFTVPAGVTELQVDARGGGGGYGQRLATDPYSTSAPGGLGARVTATVPVNPGDQLAVVIGGAGQHGVGVCDPVHIAEPCAGGAGGGSSGGQMDGGKGANTFPEDGFAGGGGGGGTQIVFAASGSALIVAGGGGGGGGGGYDVARQFAGEDGGVGGDGSRLDPTHGAGAAGVKGLGGAIAPGGPFGAIGGPAGGNGTAEIPPTGSGSGGGGGGGFYFPPLGFLGGGGGGTGGQSEDGGGGGGGAGASFWIETAQDVSLGDGPTPPPFPAPSADGAVIISWTMPTPGLSITASSASVNVGEPVTLTATLTAPGGPAAGVPTGTVTFVDSDGLPIGFAALSGTTPDVATLTTNALSIGTHNLVGAYFGDANFGGAESAMLSVTVLGDPTITTLHATTKHVRVGKSVTLTAKVSGSPNSRPVGSVSFSDDSSLLGSTTLNRHGVAKYRAEFPLGTHPIVATYSGDTTNAPSASAQVTVVVVNPLP